MTRPLPGWPRALRVDRAAAYLDVSAATFRLHVRPTLPAPVEISPGCQAWLREDLDAWLDARANRAAASEAEPNPWH